MIRSRFNFLFYFFTLLTSAFVIVGIYFLSHPHLHFRNKLGGTNSAVVPGIILVVLMGAILFYILAIAEVFSIGEDRLRMASLFKSQVLARADIQSIDLWGRSSFNGSQGEAIAIKTNDGRHLSFSGGMCRNMPVLKRALQQEYGELVLSPPDRGRDQGADAAGPITFCGNHIMSVNGLMFYGIIIAAFWMSILFGFGFFSLLFIPFLSPLLIILGIQLFYFRLTADDLEIRNHVFFWFRKRYPLANISSIVFERRYNWSHCLRVRTSDFGSRSYSAGSLRDHHWLELAKALKKRGIRVRSELPSVKLHA